MALREKCDVCQKRFKFGKHGLKCQNCGLAFHPYCFDEKSSISCQIDERLPMKTSTPTTPSEQMMTSKAKRKNKSRLEQSLFESPMLD